MKLAAFQLQALHLLVTDFAASRIFASIEPAGDFQSLGGGGSRDQIDDGLIVAQGFSAPVRGDEGKESMFDLVPFAGPWREVTDRDAQARFIGKLLQLPLPQPQAPAVAAPAIGRDQ